jgi:demethylphylloquinone reductase
MEGHTSIRVLVLGGGFAGLNTAFQLSNWPWTRPVAITLVDRNDRFLFTPMAYELLTHEVETWEIAPKYSEILGQRSVNFVQGTVQAIDPTQRRVTVSGRPLDYDYLVIALGGRPNFHGVEGAEQFSKPFYDLAHVQAFQKHVAETLDQAKQTADPARRAELLNFLIVGGGTCGVEVSCKLSDQLNVEAQARGLNREEMKIHLIDRNDRILRGIAEKLEPIARHDLERHKVNLILDAGVTKVTPQGVEIQRESDGSRTRVNAATVTWTGGIEMHPVLKGLPVEKDHAGRIRVNERLEVAGFDTVFALGDATYFPHGERRLPATAQVAVRQSEIAAWNVRAKIEGLRLLPYIYIPLGEMLTLGVDSAGADVFGMQVGGSLGAAMRRVVYLTKLPTIGLKVRVSRPWTMEIARHLYETAGRVGRAVNETLAPTVTAASRALAEQFAKGRSNAKS